MSEASITIAAILRVMAISAFVSVVVSREIGKRTCSMLMGLVFVPLLYAGGGLFLYVATVPMMVVAVGFLFGKTDNSHCIRSFAFLTIFGVGCLAIGGDAREGWLVFCALAVAYVATTVWRTRTE